MFSSLPCCLDVLGPAGLPAGLESSLPGLGNTEPQIPQRSLAPWEGSADPCPPGNPLCVSSGTERLPAARIWAESRKQRLPVWSAGGATWASILSERSHALLQAAGLWGRPLSYWGLWQGHPGCQELNVTKGLPYWLPAPSYCGHSPLNPISQVTAVAGDLTGHESQKGTQRGSGKGQRLCEQMWTWVDKQARLTHWRQGRLRHRSSQRECGRHPAPRLSVPQNI